MDETGSRIQGVRRAGWIGLLAAVVLATTACGSQRSEQELLKHDQGSAPAAEAVPSSTPSGEGAAPLSDSGTGATTESAPAAAATPSQAAAGAPSASPKSAAASAGAAASSSGRPGSAPTETAAAAPRPGAKPAQPGAGPGPGASAAAPTPETPARAGGSGGPLRIGILSTLSGPIGAVMEDGHKGALAWVAYINGQGGLNGHPVELSVIDDASDPARNRSQAAFLVEQKKVAAILMSQAPVSGQASVSYLQEKRVPVIGSEGGTPWFTRNSMYFPQMSSDPILVDVTARALADVMKPQNKNKVALFYCVEVQGCSNLARESAFKDAGLDLVYKAGISLAAPDYTPQCLAARNAGAEGLSIAVDPSAVGRIADSCASVGFKPIIGNFTQTTREYHLKNPNLEGQSVGSATALWIDRTNPGVNEMVAAIQKYAPSLKASGGTVGGWLAGKILEKAARTATTMTSEAILNGLWSIKDDDIGGLASPITYVKDAPNNGLAMKLCWWNAQQKDGKWIAPRGPGAKCADWDRKLL